MGTAGIASLGLGGCGTLQLRNPARDGFFFLHVADPQLFWGPVALWEETIAQANRLQPAFMVVGGDLINNDGESRNHDFSEDEEMAKAYLGTAKKLKVPLYNVAGNHDVCNVPTPETYAWYRERFGEPWYSFQYGACLFVVLETNVLRNPAMHATAAEVQMQWLSTVLGATEYIRHKIVFTHHPLCLKHVEEPDGYFQLPRALRKTLLELFKRHQVAAVFSGHYHRNALVNSDGLQLVTTSSSGKALGKDPTGLRIVKVLPQCIEHDYYGFDQMPDHSNCL